MKDEKIRVAQLTGEECIAVLSFVGQLIGDPNYAFDPNGNNDPSDPTDRGLAKLFYGAGRPIPEELRKVVE